MLLGLQDGGGENDFRLKGDENVRMSLDKCGENVRRMRATEKQPGVTSSAKRGLNFLAATWRLCANFQDT